MFANMVSPKRLLVPVQFENADVMFATTQDPANDCKVEVYRLDGDDAPADEGLAAMVQLPSRIEVGERKVAPQDAFVVQFHRRCSQLTELGEAFIVLGYRDGHGVVLDDWITMITLS